MIYISIHQTDVLVFQKFSHVARTLQRYKLHAVQHSIILMKNLYKSLVATATLLAVAVTSHAGSGSITLGGTTGGLERQATLSDAQNGGYGDGNASASAIGGIFGGSWTIAGDTNAVNGLSNGALTVTLTQGAWGGQPVLKGTWTIDPSFFSLYGSAVISMHVGNGVLADNPDFFAWKITDGVTTGTWSYDANIANTGGGFSNLQLWGSGAPRNVPEGSTTAALLGFSLVTASLIARRRSAA